MKLKKKIVAKPWGVNSIPAPFSIDRKNPVGEIWYEPPAGVAPELMVKYLFTSERLSIQVHPNDRQARREGFPHGKEECWYVLDAEPNAKLGLGLTKEVSQTKLRAAIALDQLEHLVDWKPVKAGDVFYVPAGTIHAIGPGLTLVEVQQNVDITYRLYDYGRPRELHIDESIKVAKLKPYDLQNHAVTDTSATAQLVDGPQFRLFHIVGNAPEIIADMAAAEWQVVPLGGSIKARGKLIAPGECGLATRARDIDLSNNERALIACTMN